MQLIGFATLASLAATTFWTASDPFVGKWRLDVSRSKIVDAMKVEALEGNRYRFSFEGAQSETVVADGTDQPAAFGTTLSVKIRDPRTMTVRRKQHGRVQISADWSLSQDGRTLRDDYTNIEPDASAATTRYLYRRVAGTSGFAGSWESITPPVGLKYEMEIRPSDNKGLSFISPGSNKTVIFDGQEHVGRDAKGDLTFSGQRHGLRAMAYTERTGGKLKAARQFELSADGRALMETIQLPGQKMPSVYVFERE